MRVQNNGGDKLSRHRETPVYTLMPRNQSRFCSLFFGSYYRAARQVVRKGMQFSFMHIRTI